MELKKVCLWGQEYRGLVCDNLNDWRKKQLLSFGRHICAFLPIMGSGDDISLCLHQQYGGCTKKPLKSNEDKCFMKAKTIKKLHVRKSTSFFLLVIEQQNLYYF